MKDEKNYPNPYYYTSAMMGIIVGSLIIFAVFLCVNNWALILPALTYSLHIFATVIIPTVLNFFMSPFGIYVGITAIVSLIIIGMCLDIYFSYHQSINQDPSSQENMLKQNIHDHKKRPISSNKITGGENLRSTQEQPSQQQGEPPKTKPANLLAQIQGGGVPLKKAEEQPSQQQGGSSKNKPANLLGQIQGGGVKLKKAEEQPSQQQGEPPKTKPANLLAQIKKVELRHIGEQTRTKDTDPLEEIRNRIETLSSGNNKLTDEQAKKIREEILNIECVGLKNNAAKNALIKLISGGIDIDHQLAEAKVSNKNKEPSQEQQKFDISLLLKAKAAELRKGISSDESSNDNDNEWDPSYG